MDIKKTGQDVLKWTVVGGSAVIAVGAVMQLTKSTNLKSAIMPLVTLLVGVSAFSYAMTAEKVGFVPEIDSKTKSSGGDENKANATGRIRSVRGNGSLGREVLVGSNWGALSCPKGQFTCSKDPNSCCRFEKNA